VDRVVAGVVARTGLDEVAPRAEIEAFEPDLVRLRPPGAVPPGGWAAAVVVVAALLLVAGVALAPRGERRAGPSAVDPRAWRETTSPTINEWPAQGGLRQDTGLLRRAADAWRADHRRPPVGGLVLLYAGKVDGASLVVLRDSPGSPDGVRVAQYFERRLSRGVESVRELGTGAGQVIMLGMTWRYLVPPWLRDVRAAVPSGRAPDWRPVRVRDGLSDPLPWRWFEPRCQNYVVLQMTSGSAGGRPRTVTQFASNDPTSATPRVMFRDPPERDERFRWAALHAVACESAATLSESDDLLVGRLWSGDLPDGGGRATMLTVDSSAASTALLISDGGRALSEPGGTNGATASATGLMAGAVWWRSPRRWHLVAAAGPRVARLKAVGELGAHETGDEPPVLVVPGPDAGARPSRLPVVQLVAYGRDGGRAIVGPW
jgi:hypothetical protein